MKKLIILLAITIITGCQMAKGITKEEATICNCKYKQTKSITTICNCEHKQCNSETTICNCEHKWEVKDE